MSGCRCCRPNGLSSHLRQCFWPAVSDLDPMNAQITPHGPPPLVPPPFGILGASIRREPFPPSQGSAGGGPLSIRLASPACWAPAGQCATYRVLWQTSANTYPNLDLVCGDRLQFEWPAGRTHGLAIIPSSAP